MKAESEQHYADLQRLGYAAQQANHAPDPNVRYYDWIVLVAQTAGSNAAWQLLVEESHVVGELEEQCLMECEARLLLPAQVRALTIAMRSASQPAELYPDQAEDTLAELQQLQNDFNRFLRATTDTGQALLLLTGP
ncbi:hypothetical protein [Hymenobacter jeollabukensis]|uniref:DUF1877 family protein n=1 Tax=Hymenobacter jeollabukensis TaxID=2025313 RepID=A0A5R8WMY3_9BACT|nr:hypothetical protein [Hymenobacter jeollabukensis]TLM90608.1 hypothetical protein FDY95_18040 [Hymenobacter jeollabukensis]